MGSLWVVLELIVGHLVGVRESENWSIGCWCWKKTTYLLMIMMLLVILVMALQGSSAYRALVRSLSHVITPRACEVGRAAVINLTVLMSNYMLQRLSDKSRVIQCVGSKAVTRFSDLESCASTHKDRLGSPQHLGTSSPSML